jgi:TonB family protein
MVRRSARTPARRVGNGGRVETPVVRPQAAALDDSEPGLFATRTPEPSSPELSTASPAPPSEERPVVRLLLAALGTLAPAPERTVVRPAPSLARPAELVGPRGELPVHYPDAARWMAIEGDVHLLLHIDEDGRVVDTRVVRRIGYGLDEVVERMVYAFHFHPALDDEGRPTTAVVPWIVHCKKPLPASMVPVGGPLPFPIGQRTLVRGT